MARADFLSEPHHFETSERWHVGLPFDDFIIKSCEHCCMYVYHRAIINSDGSEV